MPKLMEVKGAQIHFIEDKEPFYVPMTAFDEPDKDLQRFLNQAYKVSFELMGVASSMFDFPLRSTMLRKDAPWYEE